MEKKIAILGSTGSIGTSTLKIARHLKLEVVALAAKSNIELLEAQAKEFHPKLIAVFDPNKAFELQKRLPHIQVLAGMDGLQSVASFSEANFCMLAMSGSSGLLPAISAIEAGKEIGLANKEILVCAGELISSLAKKKGVQLLPVDSEHSALFQCLKGEKSDSVRRLILTASGGPFREKSMEELKLVTLEHALAHPNWKMGPKVTIDSSTLMNKGLEMIEARWLFDIDPSLIEAVIHPQSRVHSFVEFIDGSMMAQISEPDMLLPIQYALTYPDRKEGLLAPYDFLKNSTLTFFPPDKEKFRCLYLATEAMKAGGSYPCFLNAANEVLVDRFISGKISWLEIGTKLEKLISSHEVQNLLTLEAILEVDGLARKKASEV
ncbi:MAG: 1-deoxy-D-xylulose-5-phosphate reductoisomerase [Chlamydiae bacterium CG10_big_fil_rev_8_21_14_0_10_42_34]|nr:MAG: 1-deoxy-D-xylulose-5-phosphate reductoisomerase [Chlamydiae bacterium CG10_big_fil_rev_8_21_14_0_10_42_34]